MAGRPSIRFSTKRLDEEEPEADEDDWVEDHPDEANERPVIAEAIDSNRSIR